MIIKELSFSVFCKIFKEHDGVVAGMDFTNHGTVTILLTPNATWFVKRDTKLGKIVVWSEVTEEYTTHSFTLDFEDFEEIIIC